MTEFSYQTENNKFGKIQGNQSVQFFEQLVYIVLNRSIFEDPDDKVVVLKFQCLYDNSYDRTFRLYDNQWVAETKETNESNMVFEYPIDPYAIIDFIWQRFGTPSDMY